MRYGGTADKPNRGSLEWAIDTQKKLWEPLGAGIVKSLDRLATDDADRDLLRARVERELKKVPLDQHHVRYDDAIAWAEAERDQMPKDKGGIPDPRRAAYSEMAASLRSFRGDL